ncbi:hypothetical protein M9R32_13300 [Paenisporosarcina quisquiliarum]|uniref:Uncharacterized protein n=1 Tax=Paenisporosarcina quisquiliarum TaxID=365346 RepID=A0A9X3LI47_9BACL|nr:hypothetical protein [Paenisporosarcina quisquiliarum]MCZ8538167.1 hypothetical protein [Paenisporosarcina quisquiliarum]
MATKSKSKATHWFSIVALALAMLSLMYCYSFIAELINDYFSTSRMLVQLTRMIKGGA